MYRRKILNANLFEFSPLLFLFDFSANYPFLILFKCWSTDFWKYWSFIPRPSEVLFDGKQHKEVDGRTIDAFSVFKKGIKVRDCQRNDLLCLGQYSSVLLFCCSVVLLLSYSISGGARLIVYVFTTITLYCCCITRNPWFSSSDIMFFNSSSIAQQNHTNNNP